MIRRLNSDYYSRRFCHCFYMFALTMFFAAYMFESLSVPETYGKVFIFLYQHLPAYDSDMARIMCVVKPTLYVVAVLIRVFVPGTFLVIHIIKATTLKENRELFWDMLFGKLEKSVFKVRLPMIDTLLRPVQQDCAREGEKLIKGVGVKIYPTVYKLQHLLPENKKR